MTVDKRDYLSRLSTLLVFLIFNGLTKTKLAILPFLCCWEIVKNSIVSFYDCTLNGQDTQKWWRHSNSTCCNRNDWIVVRICKSWLLAIIYYSFGFIGSAFYLCRLTRTGFRSALFLCTCAIYKGVWLMYGSLSTLHSYLARIQRHLPLAHLFVIMLSNFFLPSYFPSHLEAVGTVKPKTLFVRTSGEWGRY